MKGIDYYKNNEILENSNIKEKNKTAISTREYEREYPAEFFDSLYANKK